LVRQAIDLGIKVFDTAPTYGSGRAERRLGVALAGVARSSVFLVTKVGTLPGGRKDYSPAGLLASLEGSLKRLGVPAVDAVLLHGLPPAGETGPALETLAELKKDGMTAFTGVCVRGAEVARALDVGGFDLLMAPARIDQDASIEALWARARDQGLGRLGIETLAPSQSAWRAPRHASELVRLARGVRSLAMDTGGRSSSPSRYAAEACLTWALETDCIDVAVTTTTRPDHLVANMAHAGNAAERLDATTGAP
jgi:D-threo-aldose 1-dehydrogenase